MNTNLKNNGMIALLIAMFMLAPLCNANAQATEDEFGIWATVEASKKINKKIYQLIFLNKTLHDMKCDH